MGDNLRRLRGMHGLSQEKLCVQLQRMGCDIGRTTYAKYEAGELNIRASVLIALKQIYDCTYDDFFLGLDVVQEKGLLHKEESQCSSPFSIFLGVKMRKTSVKRVKCGKLSQQK